MANSTEEAPTGATSDQMQYQRGAGAVPVPDPTLLTTQALYREIASLRELLEFRMNGMESLEREKFKELSSRMTAMEGLREEKFEKVDQEFRGMEKQFALVETQRVEQKEDTKTAVDAALQAQKEAVSEQTTASERSIAKSEAATTKSIEQLAITFTTAFDGFRRENSDLKDRITSLESEKRGTETESQHSYAVTMGLIGFVITIFITIVIIGANVLGAH